MQMRAGRTACAADITDTVTAFNALTAFNLDAAEMGIASGDTTAMIDLHQFSISALATGLGDDAGGRRVDTAAAGGAEVQTAVYRDTTGKRVPAVAKAGRNAFARCWAAMGQAVGGTTNLLQGVERFVQSADGVRQIDATLKFDQRTTNGCVSWQANALLFQN